MKAIHVGNAVLWQPGEQTRVSQTNKQTNKKPTDYYTRGRPRAPRVTNTKTDGLLYPWPPTRASGNNVRVSARALYMYLAENKQLISGLIMNKISGFHSLHKYTLL